MDVEGTLITALISKAHAVKNGKPGEKPLPGEMLSSVLDGCLDGIPLKTKKNEMQMKNSFRLQE